MSEQTHYVYLRHEGPIWTVGFYRPDGRFEPESDHTTPEAAVDRVHYLNGGTPSTNGQNVILPHDWKDRLHAIHKHELTGGERGLAIAQAISVIDRWLVLEGGA